jgi:signal transduction histidine kinase
MVVGTTWTAEPREEELHLLAAIGNQIGVAIEKARLYQNMRSYARQVVQAQEDERRRIARDLHDEIIQTLILVIRRLESLVGRSSEVDQELVAAVELVRKTLQDVRRSVRDLRPPALDHLGLRAALGGLIDQLQHREGIDAALSVEGEARRLAPEIEVTLFRIAQEALNNVRRHAAASRATVRLAFGPDAVQMVIEDNGRGFAVSEGEQGLVGRDRWGLIGMQERARALGGRVTIQSEPGQGTLVVVDVPAHLGAQA